MYDEVTLSDNSWLVTLSYELVSLFLLACMAIFSFEKPLSFSYKHQLKNLLVIIISLWQISVVLSGVDYIYRFFGYTIWEDYTIRYSAMFFFFVGLFFAPDLRRKDKKKKDIDDT